MSQTDANTGANANASVSATSSAPAPTPAVPVWSCDFQGYDGSDLHNLTVGAKFEMKCHGDIAVDWKVEAPLSLNFKQPEEQYTLAILKVEKLDSLFADFIVTGYKAGKHQPEYVRVMKGTSGFEVAKPEWQIQSVLKQGEKPQVYGPYGPFSLSLPLWIVAAVALVIALVVVAIVRTVRKGVQRRRMLEELKRHRTAMSPLHQFYRDSRSLRKRLQQTTDVQALKSISEDLNREFRLYVLRQFEIPALEWSDSAIVKDLRQRHRKVWKVAGDRLRKTLRELVRLKDQPAVELADVEQLHRMSLDTAERLQTAREEAGR